MITLSSLGVVGSVREISGSIPGSGKDFYVFFVVLCCYCVVYFFVQKNIMYLSQNFGIYFAVLIYLVYLKQLSSRC